MPANIEIKAVLRDRNAAIATASRLATNGPEIIRQQDIFFRCKGARLKLRIFHSARGEPMGGELIRYQREDRAGARRSNYSIARTPDPQTLLAILTETLGITGMVKKTRALYLIGQTRVHIDQVEGLGDFLELEVVLREGQSDEEGRQIAEILLGKFAIEPRDLCADAYLDLLAEKKPQSRSVVTQNWELRTEN
jgi:predicted adenylyl cyclase CyaB